MFQAPSHRKWASLLFLGVFLAALLHQTHHRLEEAHCHAALKACELGMDSPEGTQHLHDAHYLSEDCSLCDFFFQTSYPPASPELPGRALLPAFYFSPLSPEQVVSNGPQQVPTLRGPPTIIG
ncbi:MAG: hypothetical protein ACK5SQ_07795 [Chitinophagales bacterium]